MFNEIVGFDEIIGALNASHGHGMAGTYPPHSIEGFPRRRRRRHHHMAGALPMLIAGLSGGLDVHDLVAGLDDEESSGADLISGLGNLMAGGADPTDALMAIAGLMAPNVGNNVMRNAMERSFQPRTIDVQSRAARAPRRLALNFRLLGIGPGLSVDIPSRPQLPFRPERLFVASDIAGNFEIVDIVIGNRSQFAQSTPMAARIASEQSFGFDLHMDTAMVAMDVNLRVANITGAPSDFRATIAGTSAVP